MCIRDRYNTKWRRRVIADSHVSVRAQRSDKPAATRYGKPIPFDLKLHHKYYFKPVKILYLLQKCVSGYIRH